MLKVSCKSCGAEVDVEAKFCGGCGALMRPQATKPQAEPNASALDTAADTAAVPPPPAYGFTPPPPAAFVAPAPAPPPVAPVPPAAGTPQKEAERADLAAIEARIRERLEAERRSEEERKAKEAAYLAQEQKAEEERQMKEAERLAQEQKAREEAKRLEDEEHRNAEERIGQAKRSQEEIERLEAEIRAQEDRQMKEAERLAQERKAREEAELKEQRQRYLARKERERKEREDRERESALQKLREELAEKERLENEKKKQDPLVAGSIRADGIPPVEEKDIQTEKENLTQAPPKSTLPGSGARKVLGIGAIVGASIIFFIYASEFNTPKTNGASSASSTSPIPAEPTQQAGSANSASSKTFVYITGLNETHLDQIRELTLGEKWDELAKTLEGHSINAKTSVTSVANELHVPEFFFQRSVAHLKRGQLVEARAEAWSGLMRAPWDSSGWLLLAILFANEGDFDNAAASLAITLFITGSYGSREFLKDFEKEPDHVMHPVVKKFGGWLVSIPVWRRPDGKVPPRPSQIDFS